jgi:hypothetical protein
LLSTIEEAQKELGGSSTAGATLTLDQAIDKLAEQANDLVRETGNKDAPGSQAAYDAYHETFAANEGMIKDKNEAVWQGLEDAMHEVRDEIEAADWAKANEAAKELADKLSEAKTTFSGAAASPTTAPAAGGSTGSTGAAMNLEQVFATLADQAEDLVRETANSDAAGSQAAYNDWHATFAANEDAIKAKNTSAWQSLEDGMHEVRDAINAGDFTKANTASKELATTVTEARNAVLGGGSAEPLPTTGSGDWLGLTLVGALLALMLVAAGLVTRRTGSHTR